MIDSLLYTCPMVTGTKGSLWLAAYRTEIAKGAVVRYSSGVVMENFYSKSANRTFDTIVFVDSMVPEKSKGTICRHHADERKEKVMFNLARAGMVLLAAIALGGCASSMSGGAYSRDQARQAEEVRMATVENVRQIRIEGTRSSIGTAAGAAVGGIAGSTVGSGSGKDSSVGAVLGSVAGGVVGSAVEEGLTRQDGLEITVRFDDGRMIAVTQATDEKFQPGERVRVLTGGGVTRISH